jgi:hypothetical protein
MLIPAQSRRPTPLITLLATILALSAILGVYAMSTLASNKENPARVAAA